MHIPDGFLSAGVAVTTRRLAAPVHKTRMPPGADELGGNVCKPPY
jgi:hypothetical protein